MKSNESVTVNPIAHIINDFTEKFGIPRQSGLAEIISEIVFEPSYRSPDAVRGIEGFSHLWLIWGFSESPKEIKSLTVRPPRLGGNTHVGVFATRSPFRPNGMGLSCVRLVSVDTKDERGVVLTVSGADLMNGTPIYDIKPYLPYADSISDAAGGFASDGEGKTVPVSYDDSVLSALPREKLAPLIAALSHDPRPSYQDDGDRIYGMKYAGFDIKFRFFDNGIRIVGAEKV